MVPPAFTSQESGEVNKQVLVFNCGPLIALPSSVLECSAPPFTVHLPAALITSRSGSLSPFVSPRSAINLPSIFFLMSALLPFYRRFRPRSRRAVKFRTNPAQTAPGSDALPSLVPIFPLLRQSLLYLSSDVSGVGAGRLLKTGGGVLL